MVFHGRASYRRSKSENAPRSHRGSPRLFEFLSIVSSYSTKARSILGTRLVSVARSHQNGVVVLQNKIALVCGQFKMELDDTAIGI